MRLRIYIPANLGVSGEHEICYPTPIISVHQSRGGECIAINCNVIRGELMLMFQKVRMRYKNQELEVYGWKKQHCRLN